METTNFLGGKYNIEFDAIAKAWEEQIFSRDSDSLEGQYQEYARQKIKQSFGRHAEPFQPDTDDPFYNTMFIIKTVHELLEPEQSNKVPYVEKISSAGMTDFEVIKYKMEKTDELLFPNGENYFSTVVFDEFDTHYGFGALKVILDHFVKWQDESLADKK